MGEWMSCEVLESELQLLGGDVERWHFDQKPIILEQIGEFVGIGIEAGLHWFISKI